MTQNYQEVCGYLGARFPMVGGYDFYREVFPENENAGELLDDFSRPNAIFLYRKDSSVKRLTRRIMLNDTWEQQYVECVERNTMTLCSGLAYRGRKNTLENAQQMNALIFDLDSVGLEEIRNLFLRFGLPAGHIRALPLPTFLVASGNGLHLYYLFEKPIDLFPNIKLQMKALKYDLTFTMWDYKGTSQAKVIQYQSINQGFRMVGSINDKYGSEVVAFRVGGKVTVEDLNGYIRHDEHTVDLRKPFRPSQMPLERAKEKYPEWYERVVVNGHRGSQKWDIAGKAHGSDPWALYHWWLRQAKDIAEGHRYFYLMCLAIYASKCDVPKAQLRADVNTAFEVIQGIKHDAPFTREDMKSALEAYDKAYYHFTIDDIEKVSGLRIDRNKRNGRRQEDHLRRARAVQVVDYPNGEWRNKDGRPSAQHTVQEYLALHPKCSPKDAAAALGVALSTVYKYRLQKGG